MPKLRTEQITWAYEDELVISASNNYFIFDPSGNVFLNFTEVEGDKFAIQQRGTDLFSVKDNGVVSTSGSLYIGEDIHIQGSLFLSGATISGSTPTASHLEEDSVAMFSPISTPIYASGGFFRSSSGDWFVS